MRYCLFFLFLIFKTVLAQSVMVKGGVDIAKRQVAYHSIGETGYTPPAVEWIAAENVAVLYEHHFNNTFSVTGGLGITGRGYMNVWTLTYTSPKEHITKKMEDIRRFHYMDVPVALKVRTQVGNGFYFYGYAGPYIGCAVAGKGTSWFIRADTTGLYLHKEMNKLNLDQWVKRRWDIGYSVAFGVEIQHFFLEGAFSAGWRDINHVGLSERSTNRVAMISVGYRFEFIQADGDPDESEEEQIEE